MARWKHSEKARMAGLMSWRAWASKKVQLGDWHQAVGNKNQEPYLAAPDSTPLQVASTDATDASDTFFGTSMSSSHCLSPANGADSQLVVTSHLPLWDVNNILPAALTEIPLTPTRNISFGTLKCMTYHLHLQIHSLAKDNVHHPSLWGLEDSELLTDEDMEEIAGPGIHWKSYQPHSLFEADTDSCVRSSLPSYGSHDVFKNAHQHHSHASVETEWRDLDINEVIDDEIDASNKAGYKDGKLNPVLPLPICQPPQKYYRITDESLATDLKLHLQSIGSDSENQAHHGFKKTVSLKTAEWWMEKLRYRWKKELKGQYVDGHECDDVVNYPQNVFLPAWRKYQLQIQKWKPDDLTVEEIEIRAQVAEHGHPASVVLWFHDESTFYANNRRKLHWVHESEGALPQPKEEGASLMVADFVSADYGWLQSPDGKESAHILFKAGKSCDGYFTNEDILAHANQAMNILEKYFSNENHVFIFDNAMMHLKWADDVLAACKLPKNPSGNWGIPRILKDVDGNVMLDEGGKAWREKICMVDGRLPNGQPQSLYFPEHHEKAGWFKGMAQILVECGYTDASSLRAECEDFKCPPNQSDCCCCCLLFSQPDFTNVQVESHLESLNFIEQCWGYAKHLYRMKEWSSLEEVLEKNVLESLDAMPMLSIFSIRSFHFIDAYDKGLDGIAAPWGIKKYWGHRVLPENILKEYDIHFNLKTTQADLVLEAIRDSKSR
ncbi:hypothetical protein L210DRAFT_3507087 [Boletus edulis BED1]|uniref:Uncharacterized protein n=1 Tax=Boletus edulis BED1 TaxID=1328754 RepID=A0AAD4GAQ7_BOLED|nr:hypothetical protein L210DRAFT_3507087 [Boletus edulis BED1]